MLSRDVELRGPWTLSGLHIGGVVTKRSPGVFALGRWKANGFDACYVGRADYDVRAELLRHVQAYPLFRYQYSASAEEAFAEECELFHSLADQQPLDNTSHPTSPTGSGWQCPRCGFPGLEKIVAAADASPLETPRPETWHPTIRALYKYWISVHPPTGLPGRQHVDLCAITELLPHVFMVEVSRNPLRFRYALVGTDYAALMGRDLSGRYLDQVHPRFYGLIFHQYVQTVEQCQPAYRHGPVAYRDQTRRYNSMERLIMPLARDGKEVDMILGAVVLTTASR